MDALSRSTSNFPTYGQVPNSTWEPPAAKTPKRKKSRKGRSQFLCGQRRAVAAAFTAAKLYQTGNYTLQEAAHAVGSNNIVYVEKALVLLEAEAHDVIERVIDGDEPLLAAAAEYKKIAKALAAYREIAKYFDLRREFLDRTGLYADLASHLDDSSPFMRAEAARRIGVDAVWDSMVLPLVGNGEAAA
jgi:hypothetical protein